jgi:nucleoid-associated protein YgaU
MDKKIKQLLKTIKLNESTLSMMFGVVTVLLIGVLIVRMYSANKPAEISSEAEQTEMVTERVGDVVVEKKEDGTKVPTELPEKVTVEKGQHLWAIATKYYGSGYNYVDIAKANNLTNASALEVGQELVLPKVAVIEVGTAAPAATATMTEQPNKIEGDSYTVVRGDHLWSIAVRAYGDGYKWVEIAKANNIAHSNYIEVGQVLKLNR